MDYITIRSLQHYLYCPHRWGLIEIDRAWTENYYVVKANILHERVHSGEKYTLRGRKVFTDVDLWNDELGLIGKADCVEDTKDGFCIVEYKPAKPESDIIRHEDAMQLFAQKICFDSIFKTDCAAQVYYADVRKRFSISFEPCLMCELTDILSEMRQYISSGKIPSVKNGQRCNGCSMSDMCMPVIVKKKKRHSVRAAILKECDL